MAFWLVGVAFAFGDGSPYIGLDKFAAVNLSTKDYSKLFFQVSISPFFGFIVKCEFKTILPPQSTFAATCATIVSGAIAERCNFNGYIIFSVLVTGVTYPIGKGTLIIFDQLVIPILACEHSLLEHFTSFFSQQLIGVGALRDG